MAYEAAANERDLRTMQQLAAEVWAFDRSILNSGASVGELDGRGVLITAATQPRGGPGSGTTEARLRLGAGSSHRK
jgi:hypothetical protein